MRLRLEDIQSPSSHLSDLDKIFSTSKRVVIVSHKDPDGDAFGSTLGLWHFLTNRYPELEATMIMPNTDLANDFHFLPGWYEIISYDRQKEDAERAIAGADLIVCLDFNNWDRLGRKSPLIQVLKQAKEREGVRLIRIDHHEEPDAEAPADSVIHSDLAIVRPKSPSTCEILVSLFENLYDIVKEQSSQYKFISKDCATCLYCGIMTDTINFTARNPSARTFERAACLIMLGANNVWLYNKTYNEKPADAYYLQAAVEASTEVEDDAAWYIADQAMLQRYHYHNGYLEGMPDKALSVAGIELSFGAREEKPGTFKVGIRSPQKYDCVKIAKALNPKGGGHSYAANGTIYTDKKENVEKAIRNILLHKEDFINRNTANRR
jgi:phosphoesterase RecJ-like protein